MVYKTDHRPVRDFSEASNVLDDVDSMLSEAHKTIEKLSTEEDSPAQHNTQPTSSIGDKNTAKSDTAAASPTIQGGKEKDNKQIRPDNEELSLKDDDMSAEHEPSADDFEIQLDDLESFETTLKELSALRNKAKNLPDEQRRELAAKVALSFLRQFNDEGDEADEE